jgi:hypothetical protein
MFGRHPAVDDEASFRAQGLEEGLPQGSRGIKRQMCLTIGGSDQLLGEVLAVAENDVVGVE